MRVYRASSLGYSLEQLVAPFLGYEPVSPPDFLQAAYDEGNRLEPIIIEGIENDNYEVKDQQLEVEIEIIPGEVSIIGHIDGKMLKNGKWRLLEIKTMASPMFNRVETRGWDAGGIMEKYKWQISAYMHATGLPVTLCAWDKGEKDWCFIDAEEPFYSVEELANKVLAAEQAIRDGVLPEGCTDYPCPYFYLHENKAHVPVEQAGEELENLLSLWLDADKMEKAVKKQKDRYRELILAQSPDEALAGKIKGACGVTVSTNWVEEKHVEYDVKAHWETRIQGPRNAK